jgi:hypothetical protein
MEIARINSATLAWLSKVDLTGVRRHLLIDFDNLQPTPGEIAAWAAPRDRIWVLYGTRGKKRLPKLKIVGDQLTLIPIVREGKNSLDFQLTFFLGYLASQDSEFRFFVYSADGDYDPALELARQMGVNVERLKSLVPKALLQAPIAPEPEAVTLAKQPQAPETAKKASKAATTPTPTAGKALKASSAKKQTKPKAAQPNVTTGPAKKVAKKASKKSAKKVPADIMDRILGNLQAHPRLRPKDVDALGHHILNLSGQTAPPNKIASIIAKMQKAGTLKIVGNALEYVLGDAPPPEKSKKANPPT